VDLALTEVPFLEVVRSVLLVSWVDLGQVYHLASKLNLSETLVDEQIILLMHGAVAALAGSAENFETSSQSTNKRLAVIRQCEFEYVDVMQSLYNNLTKKADENTPNQISGD
jgi:hypothetical protein